MNYKGMCCLKMGIEQKGSLKAYMGLDGLQ